MKIKMHSTQYGSIDGIRIQSYLEGTEYDLSFNAGARSLARAFVDAGFAIEVCASDMANQSETKAILQAPENKMRMATENKHAKKAHSPS